MICNEITKEELDSLLIEYELDDIFSYSGTSAKKPECRDSKSKPDYQPSSIAGKSAKSESPRKQDSPQVDIPQCCICYGRLD